MSPKGEGVADAAKPRVIPEGTLTLAIVPVFCFFCFFVLMEDDELCVDW